MRRLIYTAEGDRTLADILVRIADAAGSLLAGEDFAGQLITRCERLATLPGTHGTARPELMQGLRSTPHKNYVIFFRYVEAALEIVAFLDGGRDLIAYFDDPTGPAQPR